MIKIPNKTLRLITFDVTNTLIKVKHDIGTEYAKVANIYGISGIADNPERIQRLTESFRLNFRKYNKELPNYGYNRNMTSVQWWQQLVISTFTDAGLNVDNSNLKKIENTSAHLFKLYSRGSQWELKHGVHDLLSELHKQRPNLNVSILSNFDERLESVLRDLGLTHYFNQIFISRQLGFAKPDHKAFLTILDKLKIKNPKLEYLHVGDSVELDYDPVVNDPIDGNSLIIGNSTKLNIDSKFVVRDLIQLKTILELE
ncbi:Haloacid dehalogenase-like hydrolase domain-containing protein 3 [Blomia tropicalis]|nr:Haloacid dehalogenase-like hydrolase domain-containing protein 3 [Blomia tropicalis]